MKGLKQIASIILFALLTSVFFYGPRYLNENFIILNFQVRLLLEFCLLLLIGVVAYYMVTSLSKGQKKFFVMIVAILNLFPIFFTNNSFMSMYGKYYKSFRVFLVLVGFMIIGMVCDYSKGRKKDIS